jgi:ribosomal protein S18 acetylase RimI-like enzyme
MTASQPDSLAIRWPGPQERRAALDLALASLPDEMRTPLADSLATINPRQSDGLLAAWRGEMLVGAVWGEVHAGRAAVAHLPGCLPQEPQQVGLALLAALEEYFAEQGARFFQIQREEVLPHEAALLRAAGLQYAGDLLYLANDLSGPTLSPRSDFELEVYRESERERLAAVIERSYEGSLDLPALDRVRSMDEVLEGYRHTGRYRSLFWRLVRREGCDVGCLLLNEHPHRQWELVYMGLAPEARGRRGGLVVATEACRIVQRAGGNRLLLAVDANNEPALRVYSQARFEPCRRSAVYLKVMKPVDPLD